MYVLCNSILGNVKHVYILTNLIEIKKPNVHIMNKTSVKGELIVLQILIAVSN